MAECQLRFRRYNNPNLPFRKAYLFGKSTRNIRIESWWSQLISSQTAPWKAYFEQLKGEGHFDGSEIDKNYLQFLYIDELRHQIYSFVEVHNTHTIWNQRNHDYLPTGKPFMMYKYPADGVQNYISEPNQPLLKHLQAEVQDWDPNQYITPEVEQFCIECLVKGGFQPRELMDFSHSNNEHKLAYIYLKDEMLKFLQGGGTLPRVKLPLGGRK